MLLQLEICNEFRLAPPIPPLGGIEPPAFRLTAERASQLRHRGTRCVLEKMQPTGKQVNVFTVWINLYLIARDELDD